MNGVIILIPVVFEPARFDVVNRNMINFFRFFRKVGKGFVDVKIPEPVAVRIIFGRDLRRDERNVTEQIAHVADDRFQGNAKSYRRFIIPRRTLAEIPHDTFDGKTVKRRDFFIPYRR